MKGAAKAEKWAGGRPKATLCRRTRHGPSPDRLGASPLDEMSMPIRWVAQGPKITATCDRPEAARTKMGRWRLTTVLVWAGVRSTRRLCLHLSLCPDRNIIVEARAGRIACSRQTTTSGVAFKYMGSICTQGKTDCGHLVISTPTLLADESAAPALRLDETFQAREEMRAGKISLRFDQVASLTEVFYKWRGLSTRVGPSYGGISTCLPTLNSSDH